MDLVRYILGTANKQFFFNLRRFEELLIKIKQSLNQKQAKVFWPVPGFVLYMFKI